MGGICSIDNLLKFLKDGNNLFIIKVFYSNYIIVNIKVFSILDVPLSSIRIENLGTGQVRLDNFNYLEKKSLVNFLKGFYEICIDHYRKVQKTAKERELKIESLLFQL